MSSEEKSEKDKSRGLKHIKNKRKYKDKTNKNPKYIPQKTQPNLGSNWDRYENEEGDSGEFSRTLTDFAILADAPITKGKHFQSKSDKLLAEEAESASLCGLFELNLEKLEKSLLTIPFYERVDIDRKHFFDNQTEYMNSEAEEHLKNYNESRSENAEIISNECIDETEENEELQFIQRTHSNEETIKSEDRKSKNEELEQWLDDFLKD